MPESLTERRAASHAPAPAEDIYELLGVQPDVGRTLAREMYWNRVEPLLSGPQRDSDEGRDRIEALNAALAIILDDDLRAEYDRARAAGGRGRRDGRGPRAGGSTLRRVALASLALVAVITALAMITVAVTSGPRSAARLLPAAVLLALLCTAAGVRVQKRRTAPLEVLGLRPGATPQQIDVAYRSRAQELLIRLAHDERVIKALDRLDWAYVIAMGAALGPEPEPGTMRRRRAARVLRAAGRMGRWSLRTAWDAITVAARGMLPLTRRLYRAAGLGERAIAARAHRLADQRAARAALEVPRIDLQERLAASFKASALRLAETPDAPDAPDAPEPAVDADPGAWLLLSAAAGTRRVPVGLRPIRIGNSRECDLVLPEREGVAAEHAMVWRRGDAVILHVTDPHAPCTVNGSPVSWARLDDGDVLLVGAVTFKVEVAAT